MVLNLCDATGVVMDSVTFQGEEPPAVVLLQCSDEVHCFSRYQDNDYRKVSYWGVRRVEVESNV